ncbi:MAG TPA: HAMP domain-containing sensor histidine kinase [Anaerolineaceae bacterium]|nr:HAMP domain-containing sensor histidine kinase [Anaerolineaceae bacterium]
MNPFDSQFHHSRLRYRDHPKWEPKRKFLLWRLFRFLIPTIIFLLIFVGGIIYLVARLTGNNNLPTLWILPVVFVFAILFPMMFAMAARRSFSSFVNPIARIMAAADAVADGDFTVRVPEDGSGEFGRLARSFNRMVAELQQSDQLRRNLTADVAHELRTPLHIIQGNLEGILDGVYQAEPDQINLLIDQTRQLTRLVDDLRTLSLAEAGQLSLKKEPVDVQELLSDVATSFSGQAEAAGINLRVDIRPGDIPMIISGDAGRLDQVLSNLIANALVHTPSGGAITLCAAPHPPGVRIQVVDNGSGIPIEDLAFIFDRFWHGDRSHQNSSGLGLAIARQLVQAHGGSITVQSQLNQGTTFTIDLPDKS